MNQSKAFLLLLVALATILTTLLVLPFLTYVLMAVLLGYMLYPLQRRLAPRIGPSISAILLVIVATVAIIVPFFAMIALIAGDAIRLATDLDLETLELAQFESTIADWTGMEVDLAESARASVERVVDLLLGTATDLFGAFVHALIGVGLAGFLLFFLLKDGDSLARWVRDKVPLPDEVQDDLYERVDQLVWAVLLGHVAVAVIQGGLAGIGLWVTGVPNAAFWTLVMIFLSLIPVVGSFLVWAPAALWLGITGSAGIAVGLFVYGITVVSISDEFLRPLIIGRAHVNPSIIIIGVIGGVYLLGVMGLFFGPIIVGALKGVVETYDKWYDELDGTGDSSGATAEHESG